MTQGDICRKLDMDRSYMSAIEGGKKERYHCSIGEVSKRTWCFGQ